MYTVRPRRTTVNKSTLSIIGVPRQMQDMTIDDFETHGVKECEDLKTFMIDYLNNLYKYLYYNKGIFFYGSNGVGKSLLASLIVKEAYTCRYSSQRLTFHRYVQVYTESWGARDSSSKEMSETSLESIKNTELLVIEEVGKEIDSRITAPILEDLLRHREDHSLATVICTNLTIPNFKEKYGESILSLVQGNMTPVKMEGKDQREHFFQEKIK